MFIYWAELLQQPTCEVDKSVVLVVGPPRANYPQYLAPMVAGITSEMEVFSPEMARYAEISLKYDQMRETKCLLGFVLTRNNNKRNVF